MTRALAAQSTASTANDQTPAPAANATILAGTALAGVAFAAPEAFTKPMAVAGLSG